MADLYTPIERPLHSGRPIRVICIGAGASGLLLAYKIQHNFYREDVDLQIYEKNHDLGGTWLENRYPGCACDCPAHTYTWSFEPKTDWSRTFASSTEIHGYFTDFAQKYNLDQFIKYDSKVTAATWDASSGKWLVTCDTAQGPQHDSCDILINASGILNNWKWPAIPGLDKFHGTKLHSANWEKQTDLTNKKVGLIGNGSSGIQILPTILPKAAAVVSFIREPTWIAQMSMPGYEPRAFTQEEIESFKRDPNKHLEFRKGIEQLGNSVFPLFLNNSDAQVQTKDQFAQNMRIQIPDKDLQERLIPDWSVGCRRLTPGVGYLEALKDSKSTVIYGEITRIDPEGPVLEDGSKHPVDVLICATGFDTTFKPRFPLIGPGGINLADRWAAQPEAYLGLAAAEFPNYFMFLGPNCPIGNGPVLIGIEAQADYFMKFIQKFREENVKSFAPKAAAVEEFTTHKDSWMGRSVWDRDCRSWYKNAAGKITAVWPGSVPHYIEVLERPRYEDFDWQYVHPANRWSFLGDGFSQREALGADLSWYIRNYDDSVALGKRERFGLLDEEVSPQDVQVDSRTSSRL